MEGLRWTAVPNGPGPSAERTRSLAQAPVGAYGGPAWGGESCLDGGWCPWRACGGGQLTMPTAHHLGGHGVLSKWLSVPMEHMRGTAVRNGRTQDSCRGGGWCLWRCYGGWQFPTARAHQLGGRGVLHRRRMECLWGTVDPNGPRPLVGGTGSPALAAVGAYGGCAGDGSSQRPETTSWGDGESCPLGGRAYGGRARDVGSQTAVAHRLEGRGVLPRQRSVPMEGLRVRAVPNGAGPPAKGTWSPARVAVNAYGGPARERRAHRPATTI